MCCVSASRPPLICYTAAMFVTCFVFLPFFLSLSVPLISTTEIYATSVNTKQAQHYLLYKKRDTQNATGRAGPAARVRCEDREGQGLPHRPSFERRGSSVAKARPQRKEYVSYSQVYRRGVSNAHVGEDGSRPSVDAGGELFVTVSGDRVCVFCSMRRQVLLGGQVY